MDCNIITQQPADDRILVSKLMSGRTGNMKSYVAVLLVSVGKENFESDALKSAVKMINQEFAGCCITVADTLQRYNIASVLEISPEEAYVESRAKGDTWLERYESYFATTFDIPYEVLRWDNLLTDPDFMGKRENFTFCTKQNPTLAEAMEHSIEEYGHRLQKRLGEAYFYKVIHRHKQNCFSYLEEECVALTLLPQNSTLAGNKKAPLVIVYPGKSTAVLTQNREIFIKDEFKKQCDQYSDFLNWLTYRFNKTRQA